MYNYHVYSSPPSSSFRMGNSGFSWQKTNICFYRHAFTLLE